MKEFQDIKVTFDKLASSKENKSGDIDLKLKLNEEKQKEINNITNSLEQSVNQIVQIEKYFHMLDTYFKQRITLII